MSDAERILAILADRGLWVRLDGDKPVLGGPEGERTSAVMFAVKTFRVEIIEHLKTKAAMQEAKP